MTGEIGLHATPIVAGNTVIVSAPRITPGGTPRSKTNEKGFVRGYDVRRASASGSSTPFRRPGEVGNDTWEKDSWSYTGNTGVWATDERWTKNSATSSSRWKCRRATRSAVIVRATNLFADSLVALDLKTGKRKWHYQFMHHDMWDWDIPCAPILATMNVNGRTIKAVAQPTKQALGLRVRSHDRTAGVAD